MPIIPYIKPSKRKISLYDLGYFLSENDYNLMITYYDYNDNIEKIDTILTATDLSERMRNKYFNYTFPFVAQETEEETATFSVARKYFKEYFDNYFNKFKKDAIGKQISAILARYNPIENYDKMSEITTDYLGTEKNKTTYNDVKDTMKKSGSEKSTFTPEGKERNKTTMSGQEKTESDFAEYDDTTDNTRVPMNSTASSLINGSVVTHGSHLDKSTTTFGTASAPRVNDTEVTFENNRKDTNVLTYGIDGVARQDELTKTGNVETDKSFTNRSDEMKEHTHGNVGVTTGAQMVAEILKNYQTNFIDNLIDEFIHSCCYLSIIDD